MRIPLPFSNSHVNREQPSTSPPFESTTEGNNTPHQLSNPTATVENHTDGDTSESTPRPQSQTSSQPPSPSPSPSPSSTPQETPSSQSLPPEPNSSPSSSSTPSPTSTNPPNPPSSNPPAPPPSTPPTQIHSAAKFPWRNNRTGNPFSRRVNDSILDGHNLGSGGVNGALGTVYEDAVVRGIEPDLRVSYAEAFGRARSSSGSGDDISGSDSVTGSAIGGLGSGGLAAGEEMALNGTGTVRGGERRGINDRPGSRHSGMFVDMGFEEADREYRNERRSISWRSWGGSCGTLVPQSQWAKCLWLACLLGFVGFVIAVTMVGERSK